MGVLRIQSWGSFPTRQRDFGAMDHGHAHAVTEAIRWLSEEVLPAAIDQDHRLHDEGLLPSKGFQKARTDEVRQ